MTHRVLIPSYGGSNPPDPDETGGVNSRVKIEQLGKHPDLLPTVARWIYEESWQGAEDGSLGKVTDLLRRVAH